MFRLIASGALIFAFLLGVACSADADPGSRHRRRVVLAPAPVPIIVPNGPIDWGLGPSGGDVFTRDNGHFNSIGNDFGTSGVLGHTNGLPAGGSTFIYH